MSYNPLPPLGQAVAGSSLPVVLPSATNVPVTLATAPALVAGSAIIGKVGTDQTTPGTTDLITNRYTRPLVLRGSTAGSLQTSYAATQNVGGLITLSTGLAAGTVLRLTRISLFSNAAASTQGAVGYLVFDTNPGSTTFTDGSALTVATADIPKIAYWTSTTGNAIGVYSANVGPYNTVAGVGTQGAAMTVDGSGQLYLAIQAGAASTYTTPGKAYYIIEFNS